MRTRVASEYLCITYQLGWAGWQVYITEQSEGSVIKCYYYLTSYYDVCMCYGYPGGEIKDNSGLQLNGFIQQDHSASTTQSPSVGGNHSPTNALRPRLVHM